MIYTIYIHIHISRCRKERGGASASVISAFSRSFLGRWLAPKDSRSHRAPSPTSVLSTLGYLSRYSRPKFHHCFLISFLLLLSFITCLLTDKSRHSRACGKPLERVYSNGYNFQQYCAAPRLVTAYDVSTQQCPLFSTTTHNNLLCLLLVSYFEAHKALALGLKAERLRSGRPELLPKWHT